MHWVRPYRHVTVAHGNWTEVSWTYWSAARFQRHHMLITTGLKTASKQRALLWSLLFPPPCLYPPCIPVWLSQKSGRVQLDGRVQGVIGGHRKSQKYLKLSSEIKHANDDSFIVWEMCFTNAQPQACTPIQKQPAFLKIFPLAGATSKESSWMVQLILIFFFTSFPHLSVWQHGGE